MFQSIQIRVQWAIVSFFCSAIALAQDPSFSNYSWSNDIKPIVLPAAYQKESEVLLSRISKVELVPLDQGKQYTQYYLMHDRLYVNSDEAIERNNKVFISIGSNQVLIKANVRVIFKNGKVIELNKNDIQTGENEEKNIKYNYFAINGIEKGVVIEKIFIYNEKPQIKGVTITMQRKSPILSNSFHLIFPKQFGFKYKSYHGLPEAELIPQVGNDTLRNEIKVVDSDVAKFDDDLKYLNEAKQMKMFRYKLDFNKESGEKNLNSYKKFVQNYFDIIYQNLEKNQQKALDQFAAKIPNNNGPTEGLIWNIESAVKKNISINDNIDTYEDWAQLFADKQACINDMTRLYALLFDKFNVKYQIVITCNRFEHEFDKDLESFENLETILFYFPDFNQYLYLESPLTRYPNIPSNLRGNYGLFISKKNYSGVTMGVSEVKSIATAPIDQMIESQQFEVDMTQNPLQPLVRAELTFTSLGGQQFQAFKDMASEEDYKKAIESYAKAYSQDMELVTLEALNNGMDQISKSRFVLKFSYYATDWVKKAGPNILFNVGQLIGKQEQMYQEADRIIPVEMEEPHAYKRHITVQLPPQYQVKNLPQLASSTYVTIQGKKAAGFETTARTEGAQVLIDNYEFYEEINYPISVYEDFRKVINASADFNKSTLILAKP